MTQKCNFITLTCSIYCMGGAGRDQFSSSLHRGPAFKRARPCAPARGRCGSHLHRIRRRSRAQHRPLPRQALCVCFHRHARRAAARPLDRRRRRRGAARAPRGADAGRGRRSGPARRAQQPTGRRVAEPGAPPRSCASEVLSARARGPGPGPIRPRAWAPPARPPHPPPVCLLSPSLFAGLCPASLHPASEAHDRLSLGGGRRGGGGPGSGGPRGEFHPLRYGQGSACCQRGHCFQHAARTRRPCVTVPPLPVETEEAGSRHARRRRLGGDSEATRRSSAPHSGGLHPPLNAVE